MACVAKSRMGAIRRRSLSSGVSARTIEQTRGSPRLWATSARSKVSPSILSVPRAVAARSSRALAKRRDPYEPCEQKRETVSSGRWATVAAGSTNFLSTLPRPSSRSPCANTRVSAPCGSSQGLRWLPAFLPTRPTRSPWSPHLVCRSRATRRGVAATMFYRPLNRTVPYLRWAAPRSLGRGVDDSKK
jgi:hypothetical protein